MLLTCSLDVSEKETSGMVVGKPELIAELICETMEVISEAKVDWPLVTELNVGSVFPGVVDEAPFGRVMPGLVDKIELIIELRSEDTDSIPVEDDTMMLELSVGIVGVTPKLTLDVEIPSLDVSEGLIAELKADDKELISGANDDSAVGTRVDVDIPESEPKVEVTRPVEEMVVRVACPDDDTNELIKVLKPEDRGSIDESTAPELVVGRFVCSAEDRLDKAEPMLLIEGSSPLDVDVNAVLEF